MILLVFLGFILAILIASVIVLGFNILQNWNPGNRRIQRDFDELKVNARDLAPDLIDIEKGELELFSLNRIRQKRKKRFVVNASGVFTTIYQEPLLAYGYRKYISSRTNAILFVTTAHHEYFFRIKKGKVRLVIDDKPIGVIGADGALKSRFNNTVIAGIPDSPGPHQTVFVAGKNVGTLKLPTPDDIPTQRAFQLFERLSENEETVFLGICVYRLLRDEIEEA